MGEILVGLGAFGLLPGDPHGALRPDGLVGWIDEDMSFYAGDGDGPNVAKVKDAVTKLGTHLPRPSHRRQRPQGALVKRLGR